MLMAAEGFDPISKNQIALPNEFRFDVRKGNQELASFAASHGAMFIDQLAYLCPAKGCYGVVPGRKSLMYIDVEHVALPAISYLAKKIAEHEGLKARFGQKEEDLRR